MHLNIKILRSHQFLFSCILWQKNLSYGQERLMKKYFCFNCQKEVEPQRFWRWRFCPVCRRLMKDNGEGFYRICDYCGANMPVDAVHCVKCGRRVDGLPETLSDTLERSFNTKSLADIVLSLFMFVLAFLLLLGILYASFYVLLAALVIGFVWVGFTFVRSRF